MGSAYNSTRKIRTFTYSNGLKKRVPDIVQKDQLNLYAVKEVCTNSKAPAHDSLGANSCRRQGGWIVCHPLWHDLAGPSHWCHVPDSSVKGFNAMFYLFVKTIL